MSNDLVPGEGLEDGPCRAELGDRPGPELPAEAFEVAPDVRIVEVALDGPEGRAFGERRDGELPVAVMGGEDEDALPCGQGAVDVVAALDVDQAPDAGGGHVRGLEDVEEGPSEMGEETARQPGPLGGRLLLSESDSQVRFDDAAVFRVDPTGQAPEPASQGEGGPSGEGGQKERERFVGEKSRECARFALQGRSPRGARAPIRLRRRERRSGGKASPASRTKVRSARAAGSRPASLTASFSVVIKASTPSAAAAAAIRSRERSG